jgi:chemosensory pili system protein ChpA (sensor histidine kinase/response regulator)
MTERREHFALDWIKRELDETLKAARVALEGYAESRGDETRMRACLTHLHQVHGTLLMLELTGVAVLSDEMEQLAQALLEGSVRDSAGAQQSLMQAILQLPAFLEDIQKGLPDSRRPVVPLANELRLARGENAFPDAGRTTRLEVPASAEGVRRFEQIDGTEKARKIRGAYQQVLLSILRGQDRRTALATLEKVAMGLEKIAERTPVEPLWRAFGAYVRGLVGTPGELGADVVKLLRRVDAELKALAQEGSAAFERPIDLDLLRLLLHGARDRGLQSADLDRMLAAVEPSAEEDPEGRVGISRREATQTAATALREELAQVKDRLDLFVRGETRSVDDLRDLAAPLKQIGSTLSILGFESSRAIVNDQVEAINAAVQQRRIDEGLLMSAASALLQIDENLAALVSDRNHRLGATGEASAVIGAAQVAVLTEARSGLEQIKQAVVDYVSAQWDVRHLTGVPDLLGAVAGALAMIPLRQAADLLGRCARYVDERLIPGPAPDWSALDNFADAISGVDYFLERLCDDAGMPSQDILGGVERSLAALGYGAGMLPPIARPSRTAQSAATTPPSRPQSVPPADVSIEPAPAPLAAAPRESAMANPGRPETAVDERARSEAHLGFALDVDEDAPASPVVVDEIEEAEFDLGSELFETVGERDEDGATLLRRDAASDAATADVEYLDVGLDDTPPAPAATAVTPKAPLVAAAASPAKPVAPAPSPAPRFGRPTVRVDADIVEIFVEEVGEVLETTSEWLPKWKADFADETALGEVRRSFHTLKGSGRIVGASLIAELAWSVENMLNRVLDGTIAANGQLCRIVEEAVALIPRLRQDFEAGRASDEAAAALIMERADVLASGGTLEEAPASAATIATPPPARLAPKAEHAEDVDTFPIFDEEASVNLDLLEARIAGPDAAQVLDDEGMRALHTLRGSAAMAGIDTVTAIADPLYRVASAARDAGATHSPDLIDFIQQGVFALRRTVKALRDGATPDEETELFAREAERLVASVEAQSRSAASLLNLGATATLVDTRTFLESWRAGAMDLATLSETIAALHELRNEAQSQALASMTSLCDALIEAYERFEETPLDDAAHAAFDAAHEALLKQFDCIAAEQTLPDAAAEISALRALSVSAVPELQEIESIPDLPEPVRETMASIVEEELIELPEIDEDDRAPAIAAPREAPLPVAPPRPSPPPTPTAVAPRDVVLPSEADPDILGIFFEEAEELLEAIDHGIQDWIGDRDNRLHAEKLLRALHTLKGGARLAGLLDLGEETHAFESVVIAAQEGAVDDEFFATAHERHDQITAHVMALRRAASGETLPAESHAEPPETPEPASRPSVRTPVAVTGPVAEASRPAVPPVVAEAPEPLNAAPEQRREAPSPRARPVATPAPQAPEVEPADAVAFARQAGEVSAPRVPVDSEMVRVSAQLLELLVDLAGESSIVRSRVEQGISDFAGALEEMATTIERVREQLRRLEIETEAQVLFRREATGPDYDEFDPLEMDRYSQLQQLARALTESASDMFDLKETLANKAREAETLLLQQARLNTEIQEGLMRTRMVPFSRLLPRLRRIVRQVAKDVGKEVEFHAYNAEGELDRNVLERMVPSLEHMLRNAVDHGIERPELRRNYGKPAAGRIDLRLSREGADVVIEIADDGGGIDVESVRAKAVERGLMEPGAVLKDEEILQFVLAPGFSTARSVTQISGRGVGMDVVHSAVKQLGGTIAITSTPGRGSRFTIRLPFTVSVNRALMVAVGEDLYAIPLNTIEGIVRVPVRDLAAYYAPDGAGFEYAGIQYRIRYLGGFLGREYNQVLDRGSVPVVLVRAGDRAVAFHVDAVQGSREIVVKSLGPQFAGVGGISGATILGDGSVVVILDLLALIRTQTASLVTVPATPRELRPICVMVVDDSVTVRKVTSRLLERQGMEVMLAKDGVEAIGLLQERRPDIVLLDIEMPRMDGFEVARQIRHDERLHRLPIIMITSRTGTKHQERAREIGVDRFLGKPFQENELLASIDDLVHGAGKR